MADLFLTLRNITFQLWFYYYLVMFSGAFAWGYHHICKVLYIDILIRVTESPSTNRSWKHPYIASYMLLKHIVQMFLHACIIFCKLHTSNSKNCCFLSYNWTWHVKLVSMKSQLLCGQGPPTSCFVYIIQLQLI